MPRSPTPPSPKRRQSTTSPRRPLSVAITGGIGAGKSEALRAFERHGAAVISSDEIVHRLLRENENVRRALVDRLGDQILGADGTIDRRAVARLVFRDRTQLTWLEGLLHPLVVREYLDWRERLAQLPEPPDVCVTEVPLLYEVGGQDRFDAVVALTASRARRAARGRAVPNERDVRLLPDDEKLRRADFAYVNDGSKADLDAFVGSIMSALRQQRTKKT